MASGTNDAKLYNQAYVAYGQGNYEEAASLIEPMAQAFGQDPDVLLLRGHIYLSLRQYDTACQQYESVLKLTERHDLLDCARQGLEQAQYLQSQVKEAEFGMAATEGIAIGQAATNGNNGASHSHNWQDAQEEDNWNDDYQVDGLDWDSAVFNEDDFGEPTLGQAHSAKNPLGDPAETTFSVSLDDEAPALSSRQNPFEEEDSQEDAFNWQDMANEDMAEFPFINDESDVGAVPVEGEATFLVSSEIESPFKAHANLSMTPEKNQGAWQAHLLQEEPTIQVSPVISDSQLGGEDNFLDNLESLSEDELEGLSQLNLTQMSADLPDSGLLTRSDEDFSGNLESSQGSSASGMPSMISWVRPDETATGDLASASSRSVKPTTVDSNSRLGWFLNASIKTKPWIAAGTTGLASFVVVLLVSTLAWMLTPKAKTDKMISPANAPSQVAKSPSKSPKATLSPNKSKEAKKPTTSASVSQSQPQSGASVFLLALCAGLSGFGTTLFFGLLASNQVKRTMVDLQSQFDTMYAGDFNVKATVHSEDEFGQLSASFNQLARIILTTTSEAQQRATEVEQAREDLQRQVIRLLDDVEGAARGDLTVEAEVTADVLGAVADAFNLTIQNLREIVRQVKNTANQVNKGTTDSESFARNNSSDALRMAEELAVTLNSVQMMTESIQRVSENAREAEEVAHTSSLSALKGGEAVERTVAGILQIRETVSETARKVKRLAEASQEISKIVALISQIASRTNLLALNASIQAARAGEAGRGFAIVADEVRQLADRSAKSLKEIEQIVLQIQSETGSVMTAMEEGIQQVIDVTDKSEQAKHSLEDIIEVSNRINTLVRSITADTVKQRENSRGVTQVMQSVELTAQETSQESQRVAGSLQKLVAISRDLLSSVERFRVDRPGK